MRTLSVLRAQRNTRAYDNCGISFCICISQHMESVHSRRTGGVKGSEGREKRKAAVKTNKQTNKQWCLSLRSDLLWRRIHGLPIMVPLSDPLKTIRGKAEPVDVYESGLFALLCFWGFTFVHSAFMIWFVSVNDAFILCRLCKINIFF